VSLPKNFNMNVKYKPIFVRQFKRLEPLLQKETLEKIERFRDFQNHKALHGYKLKGQLAGFYSFSVNYKYRIVFLYESKEGVALFTIGDHDVYKQ
jgi:plasmid maintenance system killer protein